MRGSCDKIEGEYDTVAVVRVFVILSSKVSLVHKLSKSTPQRKDHCGILYDGA